MEVAEGLEVAPRESADLNRLKASEFNLPVPEGVRTPELAALDALSASSRERVNVHPSCSVPVKRTGRQSCPAATMDVAETQMRET